MNASRRLFLARVAPLPILAPLFSAKRQHVAVPTLKPLDRDVATLDGILAAFYDVISARRGPAPMGARPDALHFGCSLRFARVRRRAHPSPRLRSSGLRGRDEFLLFSKGFFENEIHRSAVRFGNFTQVLSTYESRNTADGPVIARGINSVQLFWDGHRWWIAGAVWDDERPDNPIPPDLLPPTAATERKGS